MNRKRRGDIGWGKNIGCVLRLCKTEGKKSRGSEKVSREMIELEIWIRLKKSGGDLVRNNKEALRGE